MFLKSILLTVIAFVSGSLMFSYWIPLAVKHVDVRAGSSDGNPGSSNAISAAGLGIGLFCMALDLLKAFLPVFYAVTVAELTSWYLIPVVAAPVLGHAFSPFLRFRGGKSVSTTYGALLGLLPVSRIVFLLALTMAFFRFIAVVRPDSTGVAVSMITDVLLSFLVEPLFCVKASLILITAVVVYRMQKSPNKSEQSVSVGHFSLEFEESGIRFHRT